MLSEIIVLNVVNFLPYSGNTLTNNCNRLGLKLDKKSIWKKCYSFANCYRHFDFLLFFYFFGLFLDHAITPFKKFIFWCHGLVGLYAKKLENFFMDFDEIFGKCRQRDKAERI